MPRVQLRCIAFSLQLVIPAQETLRFDSFRQEFDHSKTALFHSPILFGKIFLAGDSFISINEGMPEPQRKQGAHPVRTFAAAAGNACGGLFLPYPAAVMIAPVLKRPIAACITSTI